MTKNIINDKILIGLFFLQIACIVMPVLVILQAVSIIVIGVIFRQKKYGDNKGNESNLMSPLYYVQWKVL